MAHNFQKMSKGQLFHILSLGVQVLYLCLNNRNEGGTLGRRGGGGGMAPGESINIRLLRGSGGLSK